MALLPKILGLRLVDCAGRALTPVQVDLRNRTHVADQEYCLPLRRTWYSLQCGLSWASRDRHRCRKWGPK